MESWYDTLNSHPSTGRNIFCYFQSFAVVNTGNRSVSDDIHEQLEDILCHWFFEQRDCIGSPYSLLTHNDSIYYHKAQKPSDYEDLKEDEDKKENNRSEQEQTDSSKTRLRLKLDNQVKDLRLSHERQEAHIQTQNQKIAQLLSDIERLKKEIESKDKKIREYDQREEKLKEMYK